MIRLANIEDLGEILKIYIIARKVMIVTGNPEQWGKSRPSYNDVVKDINDKCMYVIVENEEIVGVFTLYSFFRDYENIIGGWPNNEDYIAIHKLASSGKSRGIFNKALEFAKTKSQNIRIITHKLNKIMQFHIKKSGFQYCGIIYIDGTLERLAYQLIDN